MLSNKQTDPLSFDKLIRNDYNRLFAVHEELCMLQGRNTYNGQNHIISDGCSLVSSSKKA